MPRFSVAEALKRGWIDAPPKAPPVLQQALSPCHDLLHARLLRLYGDRLYREYRPLPDRRFRIDLAIPDVALAIEVDGFANHGRSLRGFKRDRLRQNALTIAGWRFLRFFPAQIYRNLNSVLAQIETAVVVPAPAISGPSQTRLLEHAGSEIRLRANQ